MKLLVNQKYYVTGDHSVLARPDKYKLSWSEAVGYSTYLKSIGFENVEILPQEE